MVTAVWENWGRTASCSPVRTATPRDEEEIAQVVTDSAAAGLKVKVTGTGHSFTDIACTEGVQIKLDRHARLLDVDTAARTVTVEGGIPLARLAASVFTAALCLVQPARVRRAASAWKGGKSHRRCDESLAGPLVSCPARRDGQSGTDETTAAPGQSSR